MARQEARRPRGEARGRAGGAQEEGEALFGGKGTWQAGRLCLYRMVCNFWWLAVAAAAAGQWPHQQSCFVTQSSSLAAGCPVLALALAHSCSCAPQRWLSQRESPTRWSHHAAAAAAPQGLLNGREIFLSDNFVALDDANAGDDDEYKREDDEEARINDMFDQVGVMKVLLCLQVWPVHVSCVWPRVMPHV